MAAHQVHTWLLEVFAAEHQATRDAMTTSAVAVAKLADALEAEYEVTSAAQRATRSAQQSHAVQHSNRRTPSATSISYDRGDGGRRQSSSYYMSADSDGSYGGVEDTTGSFTGIGMSIVAAAACCF